MTVDYQIGIGSGGVIIRQQVDAAASASATQPQADAGNLTVLGTTFAGSKADKANAAPRAGNPPPGPPGPGHGPPDPSLTVSNGTPAAPGQIAIFGPIVIGAGLVQK